MTRKNRLRLITRILSVCLIFIMSLILTKVKTFATSEITNDAYDTFTIGLDYNLVSSPLAYEGINVINPGLGDARDIYIDKDDIVYICDKELKCIISYNPNTKTYNKIGEDVLKGPTGVFVSSNEIIYVCDYESKTVVTFDKLGNVLRTYSRPTEALFGENSQFRPTKIVVDRMNNLYITSDGNGNGIIQLNQNGEFMGYFGPNNVNLTLSLFLKRLVLSKEDRETYASLIPKATTNLAIDNKNIIYTIIDKELGVSLKKYNISGINVLPKNSFFESTYQDITIDDEGFIYTVSNNKNGCIQVMDQEGTLLFQFGTIKTGGVIIGEFEKVTGIAIDSNKKMWVLDGGGKNIQVFSKTEFSETVTKAILAYNNGLYEEAKEHYLEIINKNASFVTAYVGLGKIEQRLQNYEEALEYFKLSNYKSGYSEVYWELRDDFLSHNLTIIVFIIIFVLLLSIIYKKMMKKESSKLAITINNTKENIKTSKFLNSNMIHEIKYLIKILRHPKDTFYDIKFHLKIRVRTALLVLVLFALINIFGDYFIRSYLFINVNPSKINFVIELLRFGLIIVIFVIGNYLISTLQGGEGFFRDILIGAIFSFAPVILFKLPIDIISNVLTYNEAYLYDIANYFIWIWSFVNLLLMIKEIHNYSVKQLIVNILLTIISVVIMIILFLVLYILSMQLFEFIVGIINERIR